MNIGLVLLCPGMNFLKVETSRSNDRLKKLFGNRGFNAKNIDLAKQAMENRLTLMEQRIHCAEDLVNFASTCGNDLLLTSPRPTAVTDPEADFTRLYEKLVDGPRASYEIESPRPSRVQEEIQKTIIARPDFADKIQVNPQIEIPQIGRFFRASFAYNNGNFNIVRCELFSRQEDSAIRQAERLGGESLLVQSARTSGGKHQKVTLIPDSETLDAPALQKVEIVLKTLGIRVFSRDQIEVLASEIEHEAHS